MANVVQRTMISDGIKKEESIQTSLQQKLVKEIEQNFDLQLTKLCRSKANS